MNVVLISFIFISGRGSVNMKCGINVDADENTRTKQKITQGVVVLFCTATGKR